MQRLSIDFSALFDAMPTPFMILDHELKFRAMNAAYLAMTGRAEADLLGRFVFDAFPDTSEREHVTREAMVGALAGTETSIKRNVFAIERPGIGRADVYWDIHHTPVRNDAGEVVALLQHSKDVTSEVMAERMRDVVSQEYDHRVRNLMTRVSAIVRHAARHSTDTASFLADFERRIAAMTRTHELLVNGGWEQLGLAALVTGELGPYGGAHRAHIEGENVSLSSRVAQALGMALHELTTNAAKHGALSVPEGSLSVRWQGEADTGLRLVWRETGAPPARPNGRSGFGTTIIDRILPMETGGTVTRILDASGLVCTIIIPEPQRA